MKYNMINPRKNIIISTSLFVIPGIYGLYKKQYILSLTSFASAIASINYWRHPIVGPRKNIDLFVSKACGLIFFIYGYNYVNTTWLRLLGYTNGICMISMYNTSCILSELQSETWELYHMLFHISGVVGKLLVISAT